MGGWERWWGETRNRRLGRGCERGMERIGGEEDIFTGARTRSDKSMGKGGKKEGSGKVRTMEGGKLGKGVIDSGMGLREGRGIR